jgi:pyruvate/2-oxoglutarate/acetoin dehydrogenase E1 component
MSADLPPNRLFFREAICRAMQEAMREDPDVLLLGQDVGAFGGPYREFVGLQDEFGALRVRDTPVAEAVMVGLGVGAAAAGLRPVVSITYMDFLMLGLDPLINYGVKARFKTGGQLRAPVVIKTTAGAKGQGVAHSQCIESWMMNVPGLTIMTPSTPADAYGLLRTALTLDGPVLFIDHKRLFPTSGPVPQAPFAIPAGEAVIRRRGRDLTLAAHGAMALVALEAADLLAAEAIDCEVIDLRCLSPLDAATVALSAARTGALVTLEEGQLSCGVGTELIYRVGELASGIRTLRLGPLRAPVSSNPVLEAAVLPNYAKVAASLRQFHAQRLSEGRP